MRIRAEDPDARKDFDIVLLSPKFTLRTLPQKKLSAKVTKQNHETFSGGYNSHDHQATFKEESAFSTLEDVEFVVRAEFWRAHNKVVND